MYVRSFSYQYEDYDEKVGVLYETDEKMFVKLSISCNECTLSANREGLLALAKSLIKLVDANVPKGSHFHLDSPVFMKDGSAELIIDKI